MPPDTPAPLLGQSGSATKRRLLDEREEVRRLRAGIANTAKMARLGLAAPLIAKRLEDLTAEPHARWDEGEKDA